MLRNAQASQSRPRKVGLVIVHGVGEAEAGYCLDSVVGKLESRRQPDGTPSYEFTSYSDHERLTEPPDGKSAGGSFPVFSRQGLHADGTRISAVELYWADTTALLPGRVNTLMGFFRVIFESQHIVHAMLNRGGDLAAQASRHLLLLAAWLLRGPIAALTIAVSAFSTVLLFEPRTMEIGPYNAHWKFLIVQALLCGLAMGAFYMLVVKRRELTWYDLIFWLFLFTVLLLALDATGTLFGVLDIVPPLKTPDWIADAIRHWFPEIAKGHHIAGDPECGSSVQAADLPGCYVGGLYKVIIWMWRIWGILLLGAVATCVFAWLRASRKADRAVVSTIATSIGVLVLQFLLWTTVVVSVLYPMLNRAEFNAALNYTLKLAGDKSVLDAKLEAAYAESSDPLVVTAREFFQLADIHPDWIFRFKFIYVAATVTLLVFVLGAGVIMFMRRRWAFSGLTGLTGEALDARLRQNARRMPRLLFNRRLVLILILSFLTVMALIYWQSLLEFNPAFVSFRSIFLPVAALIAIIVPMAFGPWITNVVHIARDIIDHQYQPKLETAATFLPKLLQPEEGTPRRTRLQNRLQVLLDRHFRDAGCSEIVFLAHSQGSVVIYDYLRRAGGNPELGGAAASFISCGSPLGTIYQTYFYEYGQGNPSREGRSINARRWVNLYRVDDYIGGAVTGPEDIEFSNVILAPGQHRHMYYWSENAVGDALDAFITGAATPVFRSNPPAHATARAPQLSLLGAAQSS